jgi:hypothetical protein
MQAGGWGERESIVAYSDQVLSFMVGWGGSGTLFNSKYFDGGKKGMTGLNQDLDSDSGISPFNTNIKDNNQTLLFPHSAQVR